MKNRDDRADILHVGWGHPPATGGGPIFYLQHLCRRQQVQGRTPACFVAGMTPPAPEKEPRLERTVLDGVPYDIVNDRPIHYYDWSHPEREIRHAGIEALFVETLKLREPEIVHFHNLVGLSMSLVKTAKRLGAATLFSVHNYWMLCPRDDLFAPNEESCPGPRDGSRCAACVGQPHRVVGFMERVACAGEAFERHADRILAVSSGVKAILVQNGVPEDKILVNHIGSAAAENNWRRLGAARTRNPRVTEPVRFAYFGAMAPRKGAHVLVEAAAQMEDYAGRFRVELHGWNQPDPFMARLEHLIERKSFLKETVQFRGKYTQEDQPVLLQEVHASVIPPIWEDNGPQTVMEALGAGTPVIGARIGGIPDFVRHGENGLLFRAGDGSELASIMKGLVDRPDRLEALTRGITPPLGMDRHVSDLEAVYEALRETRAREHIERKNGEAWAHIGVDACRQGRYEEAEEAFQKSIALHPLSAESRYRYALLLETRERLGEAVSMLEEALALNPDHARAHNDLGVHRYGQGRTEEALQHLARAYTLDRKDTDSLRNMAAIYLDTGQEAKALEIYRLILTESPDDPDALNMLGVICSRLERYEDAKLFWSRALEIVPDHDEARSHLETLKQLLRSAPKEDPAPSQVTNT